MGALEVLNLLRALGNRKSNILVRDRNQRSQYSMYANTSAYTLAFLEVKKADNFQTKKAIVVGVGTNGCV